MKLMLAIFIGLVASIMTAIIVVLHIMHFMRLSLPASWFRSPLATTWAAELIGTSMASNRFTPSGPLRRAWRRLPFDEVSSDP